MADAGLRVSEATALHTTDLVTEGGACTHVDIRRGKGGKPGRPISTEYVRQLVHRLALGAGIATRVTPHTLSHTFATRLLRVTGNVELTRKALRHANIHATAETYARLT
jgi:site-specific recombinase XerD